MLPLLSALWPDASRLSWAAVEPRHRPSSGSRPRAGAAAAVAFCVAVLGLAPEAHAALPEAWTREWRGDDASEDFGGSLDFAGDVDGDGHDDIVIGAEGSRGNRGRLALYLGQPDGAASAPWTVVPGQVGGAFFGHSVAGVGDTNADGFDDVATTGFPPLLLLGGADTFPSGEVDLESTGGTQTYAGPGDLDGDGFFDIVSGDTSGNLAITPGGPQGIDVPRRLAFADPLASDPALPDLGGDGLADLCTAVGTRGVYVRDGDSEQVVLSEPWILPAESRAAFIVLASLGDFNGDGYEDLAAADSSADSTGIVAIYGGGSGHAVEPLCTLHGDVDRGFFGAALAGPGDLDQDGFADLGVGSRDGVDWAEPSHVYLFLGNAAAACTEPAGVLAGPTDGEEADVGQFGAAVAGGGDADADGVPDLLIGGASYEQNTGRAWLILGVPAPDPGDTGDTANAGDTGADGVDSGDSVSAGSDVGGCACGARPGLGGGVWLPAIVSAQLIRRRKPVPSGA